MLIRSNDERTQTSVIRWIPMEELFSRKDTHLAFNVIDVYGAGNVVMFAILELLNEAFEYAVRDDWSYERRKKFYREFPFDYLDT